MILNYLNFVLHLKVKPKSRNKNLNFVVSLLKTRMALWVQGLCQYKYDEKPDYVTELDIMVDGSIMKGTNIQAIDSTLKELSP